MLSAYCPDEDRRILAADITQPLPGIVCPSCHAPVLLKRGRVRIPHFAHRADHVCPESAGETERHRECKQALYDALCAYGPMARQIELEKRYPDYGVRADVFATIRGAPVAIELQRSNLAISDLERRTRAYAALGIAVLWIVAHVNPPDVGAERYAPRDWERWLHEMYWGRVYYWVSESTVVPVAFAPYMIHVEERSWYEPGGYEEYAGGYSYASKRFVTPHRGPLVDVTTDFVRTGRRPHTWNGLNYPQAWLYIGCDATPGAVQFKE